MKRVFALVLIGTLMCCSDARPAATSSPTDDTGRARLLVLTQSDLPDGWRSSSHRSTPVADREEKRLAACIGAPNPATSLTADLFGDVFGQGAQTITSEVVFLRTSAEARDAIAALKSDRAIPCAEASVRPVLAEQLRLQGVSATIRSIAVTRRTLAVKGLASFFRVVVDLVASGATLTVQQDVVVLARGRTQVHATFLDIGVAFQPALELSLVKKLSDKLFR